MTCKARWEHLVQCRSKTVINTSFYYIFQKITVKTTWNTACERAYQTIKTVPMAEFFLSLVLSGTQKPMQGREARGQTQPQSGHCRPAAPPPLWAHLHGNAGLCLSPPSGAADRKQSAPRASGKLLWVASQRLLWTAKLLWFQNRRFAREWRGGGREWGGRAREDRWLRAADRLAGIIQQVW